MKNYNVVDIAKFIMAIFVVMIHTSLYVGNNLLVRNIYETIIRCAVPFFFIVTGFFLYKDNSVDDMRIKNYLKKMINLYIIWNIIYFPISIYNYVINHFSLVSAIGNYLKGFFFKGEHFYSWPLWYLLAIIYSLLFILLLRKLKVSDKKIYIITLFIFCFGILMNYLVNQNCSNMFVIVFKKFFSTGRLFTAPLLLSTGYYINKYKITINKFLLLIIMVICFIICVFYPNEISSLILHICLVLLILQLNNIKINTIYFRKCSIIIYFLHMINLFTYLLLVGKNNVYGLGAFIYTVTLSIIESIIIILIQKKYNLKILNLIF